MPTAKAVVDALKDKISKSELDIEMDKYATDDEVNQIVQTQVEIQVNEAIIEQLNNNNYEDLLSSINNFKNNI